MKTPREVAESWTEDTEITLRSDIRIAITTDRKETLEAVLEIVENNRRETMWGDTTSQEISDSGIDDFIKVVKEKLTELLT